MPPGAEVRQDFKVGTEKEDKDGAIFVTVEDPDGKDDVEVAPLTTVELR